jgi:hypothetical protein
MHFLELGQHLFKNVKSAQYNELVIVNVTLELFLFLINKVLTNREFCRRLSHFPANNPQHLYNVGFNVFNITHSEMSCMTEQISKCWYRSKLRRHSRLG